MLVQLLQKNKFLRDFVYKIGKPRAHDMVSRFEGFLKKSDKILDFGAGSCHVYELLTQKGYDLKPIDVQDNSFVEGLHPMIYDGDKIPYGENYFDSALVLTVLHHTSNPEAILKEVMRVSKSVIIMEDIYYSPLQKYVTYFMDSLFNLEFIGHPHSNMNDTEWKSLFKAMGLELVEVKYHRSFVFFRHAIYYLKK